ncbi:hypothetical protein T484DRAFT_1816834 [Baffinella frigidus]|nr:hypothetical protein T484DRAFT_1816834 [Cryptophyta sp. CCMP2293]
MASWRHEIVGEEFRTLVTLQQRVKLTLLLILTLSTVGFVFTDSVLFSTQAKTNLEHMDLVGAFRTEVLTSAYLLRSQMLAAHHGHEQDIAHYEDEILENMDKLTKEHVSSFDTTTSQQVEEFYQTHKVINVPTLEGWREVDQTYWTFGNDFARKVRLASSTALSELANSNFKLSEMSEAKRAVVYVQETVFTLAIPFFKDAVEVYNHEVETFGVTAISLMVSNAVVNSLLVIVLYYTVSLTIKLGLRSNSTPLYADGARQVLSKVVSKVQYQMVACRLGFALPRVTAKKLYVFYKKEHFALATMGDEDIQRDLMIEDEAAHDDDAGHEGEAEQTGSNDMEDWDFANPLMLEPPPMDLMEEKSRFQPATLAASRLEIQEVVSKMSTSFLTVDQVPEPIRGEGSPTGRSVSPTTGRPLKSSLKNKSASSSYTDSPEKMEPRGTVTLKSAFEYHGTESNAKVHGGNFGGVFGHGRTLPSAIQTSGGNFGFADEDTPDPRTTGMPISTAGDDTLERVQSCTSTDFLEKEYGTSDAVRSSGSPGARATSFRIDDVSPLAGSGVPEKMIADVVRSMTPHQSLYFRQETFNLVLFIILGVCITSIVLPSRYVGHMVNLGPTTDHAGYRRSLVRSAAHLTRELILDDGFSRMTKGEIAGTLENIMLQFTDFDHAVRRGNAHGVKEGADVWSPEHNVVMYHKGCPWRDNPDDCTMEDYPDAAGKGLYALSLQFVESVQTILDRFGGDKAEWVNHTP